MPKSALSYDDIYKAFHIGQSSSTSYVGDLLQNNLERKPTIARKLLSVETQKEVAIQDAITNAEFSQAMKRTSPAPVSYGPEEVSRDTALEEYLGYGNIPADKKYKTLPEEISDLTLGEVSPQTARGAIESLKMLAPSKEPVNVESWRRKDGSFKGPGWQGDVGDEEWSVTEKSITVNIDGKEMEIPSIVPGTTKEEIEQIKNKKITKPIIDKAVEHALGRIKEGKSPFKEWNEDDPWVNLPETGADFSAIVPVVKELSNVIPEIIKKDSIPVLSSFATAVANYMIDIAPNEPMGLWDAARMSKNILGIKELPKGETVSKIQTWMNEKNEEVQKQKSKWEEGSIGSYAQQAYESIGMQIPAYAAGIIAKNPNLSLGIMYLTSTGNSMQKYKELGVPEDKALVASRINGLVEVGTEIAPTSYLFKAMKGGLLKNLTKATLHDVGLEQINSGVQQVVDDITTGVKPDSHSLELYKSTLISTVAQMGVMSGIATGVNKYQHIPASIKTIRELDKERARIAEESNRRISQLNAIGLISEEDMADQRQSIPEVTKTPWEAFKAMSGAFLKKSSTGAVGDVKQTPPEPLFRDFVKAIKPYVKEVIDSYGTKYTTIEPTREEREDITRNYYEWLTGKQGGTYRDMYKTLFGEDYAESVNLFNNTANRYRISEEERNAGDTFRHYFGTGMYDRPFYSVETIDESYPSNWAVQIMARDGRWSAPKEVTFLQKADDNYVVSVENTVQIIPEGNIAFVKQVGDTDKARLSTEPISATTVDQNPSILYLSTNRKAKTFVNKELGKNVNNLLVLDLSDTDEDFTRNQMEIAERFRQIKASLFKRKHHAQMEYNVTDQTFNNIEQNINKGLPAILYRRGVDEGDVIELSSASGKTMLVGVSAVEFREGNEVPYAYVGNKPVEVKDSPIAKRKLFLKKLASDPAVFTDINASINTGKSLQKSAPKTYQFLLSELYKLKEFANNLKGIRDNALTELWVDDETVQSTDYDIKETVIRKAVDKITSEETIQRKVSVYGEAGVASDGTVVYKTSAGLYDAHGKKYIDNKEANKIQKVKDDIKFFGSPKPWAVDDYIFGPSKFINAIMNGHKQSVIIATKAAKDLEVGDIVHINGGTKVAQVRITRIDRDLKRLLDLQYNDRGYLEPTNVDLMNDVTTTEGFTNIVHAKNGQTYVIPGSGIMKLLSGKNAPFAKVSATRIAFEVMPAVGKKQEVKTVQGGLIEENTKVTPTGIVKKHRMTYTMPVNGIREELREQFPRGSTTLDMIRAGYRTATTRSYALGRIGDIITFEDDPQQYMVTGTHDSKWINANPEEWSKLEAWDVGYIKADKKLNAQVFGANAIQTVFQKVSTPTTVVKETGEDFSKTPKYEVTETDRQYNFVYNKIVECISQGRSRELNETIAFGVKLGLFPEDAAQSIVDSATAEINERPELKTFIHYVTSLGAEMSSFEKRTEYTPSYLPETAISHGNVPSPGRKNVAPVMYQEPETAFLGETFTQVFPYSEGGREVLISGSELRYHYIRHHDAVRNALLEWKASNGTKGLSPKSELAASHFFVYPDLYREFGSDSLINDKLRRAVDADLQREKEVVPHDWALATDADMKTLEADPTAVNRLRKEMAIEMSDEEIAKQKEFVETITEVNTELGDSDIDVDDVKDIGKPTNPIDILKSERGSFSLGFLKANKYKEKKKLVSDTIFGILTYPDTGLSLSQAIEYSDSENILSNQEKDMIEEFLSNTSASEDSYTLQSMSKEQRDKFFATARELADSEAERIIKKDNSILANERGSFSFQRVSTAESVESKQSNKKFLKSLVEKGIITDKNPVRMTDVGELASIVKNKSLGEGRPDAEGHIGISAQYIDGKKPVVGYGDNNRISIGIIFDDSQVESYGNAPNEVKIKPDTDVNSLRFTIGGREKVFTFAEVQKIYSFARAIGQEGNIRVPFQNVTNRLVNFFRRLYGNKNFDKFSQEDIDKLNKISSAIDKVNINIVDYYATASKMGLTIEEFLENMYAGQGLENPDRLAKWTINNIVDPKIFEYIYQDAVEYLYNKSDDRAKTTTFVQRVADITKEKKEQAGDYVEYKANAFEHMLSTLTFFGEAPETFKTEVSNLYASIRDLAIERAKIDAILWKRLSREDKKIVVSIVTAKDNIARIRRYNLDKIGGKGLEYWVAVLRNIETGSKYGTGLVDMPQERADNIRNSVAAWASMTNTLFNNLKARGYAENVEHLADYAPYFAWDPSLGITKRQVKSSLKRYLIMPEKLKEPAYNYLKEVQGTQKPRLLTPDMMTDFLVSVRHDMLVSESIKNICELYDKKREVGDFERDSWGKDEFGNPFESPPVGKLTYQVGDINYVVYSPVDFSFNFSVDPSTGREYKTGNARSYLIPEKIANYLDEMTNTPGSVLRGMNAFVRLWKRSIIYSIFPSFNWNNAFGDFQIYMMTHPDKVKASKEITPAFMFAVKYFKEQAGKTVAYNSHERRLKDFIDRFKTIESSQMVTDLTALDDVNILKHVAKMFNKVSTFRESILRVAVASYLVREIDYGRGEELKKKFAYMHIEPNLNYIEFAGRVSQDMMINYLRQSPTYRKWITGCFLPWGHFYIQGSKLFYKWMVKGNTPMERLAGFSVKSLAMMTPSLLANLWNQGFFFYLTGDEDKALKQKRMEMKLHNVIRNRFHLIIGDKVWVPQIVPDILLGSKIYSIIGNKSLQLLSGEISAKQFVKNTLSDWATTEAKSAVYLVNPLARWAVGVATGKDPLDGVPVYPEFNRTRLEKGEQAYFASRYFVKTMNTVFSSYVMSYDSKGLSTEESVKEGLKRFYGLEEIFGVKDIKRTPRLRKKTGRYNYILDREGEIDITSLKQEKEMEMDARLSTVLRDIETDWVRSGKMFNQYAREGNLVKFKDDIKELFGGKVNKKELEAISTRLKRMSKDEKNLIRMIENKIRMVGEDSPKAEKYKNIIYLLRLRLAAKNKETTKAVREASDQIEKEIIETED